MNPRTYMTYKWSSLPAYLGEPYEDWLSPERAMTMTPTEYRVIDEYTDKKKEFGYIRHLLAGCKKFHNLKLHETIIC